MTNTVKQERRQKNEIFFKNLNLVCKKIMSDDIFGIYVELLIVFCMVRKQVSGKQCSQIQ